MTTATMLGTITRDDITALKLADDVTAHQHEGVGILRCHMRTDRGGEPRIFTATEQRLFTEVDSYSRRRSIEVQSVVGGYHNGDAFWAGAAAECFETVGPYTDEVFRTVVDLLRPEDRLCLSWVANAHSNGYSKAATGTTEAGYFSGLHVDELRLVVTRGERRMVFSLDTSVCAENSARMIRRV